MDFSLDQLIHWLAAHQDWILIAIAIVAFLESLALVGIIVPGIALLIAASTAAGSAGINPWPMLLAGFVGSVLGDGVSFLLGYRYHELIRRFPLLQAHPEWVAKGEKFFYRYGTMGIVLGRFVGPIRPVMPLVAGLLQMPPSRFFFINFLSALAWSPFYLMPGYLVGRSLDGQNALSTEHLVFLLGVVLAAWLMAQLTLSLYLAIEQRQNKRLRALLLAISLGLLFIALGIALRGDLLLQTNTAVAHWMLALRHPWLDLFFIGLTALGEYLPMMLWATLVALALALQRNYYAATLWAGFTLLAQALMELGKRGFALPRPELVQLPPLSLAYPSGHTCMILVFAGLLASFMLPSINARRYQLILSATAILVMLVAAARLYLTVHWLTDIVGGLLLGGFVLTLFYLVVLRWPFHRIRPVPLLIATALAWLINIAIFVAPDFTGILSAYAPYPPG